MRDRTAMIAGRCGDDARHVLRGQLGELTAQVREGRTAASVAARRLLDLMT